MKWKREEPIPSPMTHTTRTRHTEKKQHELSRDLSRARERARIRSFDLPLPQGPPILPRDRVHGSVRTACAIESKKSTWSPLRNGAGEARSRRIQTRALVRGSTSDPCQT